MSFASSLNPKPSPLFSHANKTTNKTTYLLPFFLFTHPSFPTYEKERKKEERKGKRERGGGEERERKERERRVDGDQLSKERKRKKKKVDLPFQTSPIYSPFPFFFSFRALAFDLSFLFPC